LAQVQLSGQPLHYRKIWLIGIVFLMVIITGTIGYMIIEGWNPAESLYMTIITLSTVGFQEVRPLSNGGRVFTVFLIVVGIGTAGYGVGNIAAFLVEGHLRDLFREKKMEKAIEKLQDHIIVCGYGVEGRHACDEFKRSRVPFLVIEKDSEVVEKLKNDDYLVIKGDATHDEIILQAGVATAKGLIAAVNEDSENVFITLTARGFNPKLMIVAKASDEKGIAKLFRAGANKVISSAEIGGKRMASVLLRPNVVNFLDVIIHDQQLSLRLEEIKISDKSSFVGKSIRDLNIRGRTGTMVIGYHREGQSVQINPDPDTILNSGDILVVMGNENQIEELLRIVTS